MRRLTLLLLIVALAANLSPARAVEVFTVDVCRIEDTGMFRATVTVDRDPQWISYTLDWWAWPGYADWNTDLGWIGPDQTVVFTFTLPADNQPNGVTFLWFTGSIWLTAYHFPLDDTTPLCPAPLPGCDQFMPTGELVTFTSTTPLLWAPDTSAQTGYSVLAGQSAKLIGVEGDYARIVWACDGLWVRWQ